MTKLGFHPPLTRLYIFIKNEANSVWYYLEDGQKHYIQESALTGVLKRLDVREAETSFNTELKADFEIVADRRYVLRSGIETAFTKGMLMAIAALSDDRLNQPITIELKAGKEKGNVLVSVRDPETFEFIKTGTWENANWNDLMQSAIARLGGSAHPQHNSLIKSIRQVTAHTSEQVADWCREYGAAQPSELSPALFDQLVEALCLGWGQQFFASEEQATDSFRKHVQAQVAAGEKKGDAIASWLESVRAIPASR